MGGGSAFYQIGHSPYNMNVDTFKEELQPKFKSHHNNDIPHRKGKEPGT